MKNEFLKVFNQEDKKSEIYNINNNKYIIFQRLFDKKVIIEDEIDFSFNQDKKKLFSIENGGFIKFFSNCFLNKKKNTEEEILLKNYASFTFPEIPFKFDYYFTHKKKLSNLDKISKDLLKCPICFETKKDLLIITPCLHHFCYLCIKMTILNSNNKKCPICKSKINIIQSDFNLKALSENYFKSEKNSQEKRIFINLTESSEIFKGCKECVFQRKEDEWKCKGNSEHFICKGCKQYFPKREKFLKLSRCDICEENYCNKYYGFCPLGNKLEFFDEYVPNNFNGKIFRDNLVEKHYYEKIMDVLKIDKRDIFRYFLEESKESFIFDKNKSIFSVNKKFELGNKSLICPNCFDDIWLKILIDYKKKFFLKEEEREDCWYGINCTTMKHSIPHREKFNHFCTQKVFDKPRFRQ